MVDQKKRRYKKENHPRVAKVNNEEKFQSANGLHFVFVMAMAVRWKGNEIKTATKKQEEIFGNELMMTATMPAVTGTSSECFIEIKVTSV